MQYEDYNDTRLPAYVSKLNTADRKKWVSVYSEALKSSEHRVALIAANKWLDRKLKEKKIVARSQDSLVQIHFEVDDTSEFIVRSEDGETFLSAVLASTKKLADGVALPESVLLKWADKINAGLPVGDADHEFYNRVLSQNLSDDDIAIKLKNKTGIVKAVKAVVDQGKLWLRLMVDKRYRKALAKAKGLSVEALLTKDNSGNITDADFLGFTVCINQPQADPEATII